MQRDLVVVILYSSIYNQYKIVKKYKIANIINYQCWEQFRFLLSSVGVWWRVGNIYFCLSIACRPTVWPTQPSI